MKHKPNLLAISISFIVFLGFFILFMLFRENNEIPVLAEVESFKMNSITGEQYYLDNKKLKLVTFFYTNCPDICPMTMSDLKELQFQLQKGGLFGTKVEILSITLDPENDSIEVINDYAKAFDANYDGWKFLRGSPDKTKEVAELLKMKYKKISGDFISHNTVMYLIDQDNKIRGLYNMANAKKPIDKEEIMKTIKKLTD